MDGKTLDWMADRVNRGRQLQLLIEGIKKRVTIIKSATEMRVTSWAPGISENQLGGSGSDNIDRALLANLIKEQLAAALEAKIAALEAEFAQL